MGYPDKPAPEGLRLRPELAEAEPVVSRDGQDVHLHHPQGRPFLGRQARDGPRLQARARAHPHAGHGVSAADFSDIVGAQEMLDGKATTLGGAVAKGRTLTLRLTTRARDFLFRTTSCARCLRTCPSTRRGPSAPLPSAAPYYAAEYVPGERLVLERNRFYKGNRVAPRRPLRRFPQRRPEDRDRRQSRAGSSTRASSRPRTSPLRAAELVQRYGINKRQFFIQPGFGLRLYVLNTSRPLFKNNPKLRQAVNFAVDRRRLARELGPRLGTATDQYVLPVSPGFRDERIYPLKGPNLKKAKQLAKGAYAGRQGGALHAQLDARVAWGQILKENLEALGLEVARQAPARRSTSRRCAPSASRSTSPTRAASAEARDASFFLPWLFDGRTIANAPNFGNWSRFDSTKYNRLLDEASRLTGAARNRAYGELECSSRATPLPRSPSRRSTRTPSSPLASAASS